jgi:hypothetical protein
LAGSAPTNGWIGSWEKATKTKSLLFEPVRDASEIELLNAVAEQPFETCEAEWKGLLRSPRLGLALRSSDPSRGETRQMEIPAESHGLTSTTVPSGARYGWGIVDIRPNQHREILAWDLNYRDADGEPVKHDEKLGMALHQL